jgi:hypothetical protein
MRFKRLHHGRIDGRLWSGLSKSGNAFGKKQEECEHGR